MRKKRPPLTIEPILPFALSNSIPPLIQQIWLVGVGGTGSLIAASLARMLYHISQQAGYAPPRVILIDGDVVEEGNIGRQNFSRWDVGYSKAEVIAARYNTALGTRMEAIHSYFSGDLVREISESSALRHTLLVSAVDDNAARREIAAFLVKTRRREAVNMLWADVGNGEFTGQLVVGNTLDPDDIRRLLSAFRRRQPAPIHQLPAVMLVHPEMSDPAEDPRADEPPRPACAAAMAQDRQSLTVNDMAARVTVNAIYALLKFATLNYFAVFFNCRDNFALPLYNTRANFQRIVAAQRLRPLSTQ
jgi:PRTRC genetic system ThiF family protein